MPSRDDPPIRNLDPPLDQVTPDDSWHDDATTAGAQPYAVWVRLRAEWPYTSMWCRPDTPAALDHVYAHPQLRDRVTATIADLADPEAAAELARKRALDAAYAARDQETADAC